MPLPPFPPGRMGLFSSNEEHDDIPTTSLSYLLIPYYIAEVRVGQRGRQ